MSEPESVAKLFAVMPPDSKDRFVDDTLAAIIHAMSNPKKSRKLIKAFFKGKKPTPQQKEYVNQLVIAFLYSIKEEFRYQWAYIVYKILRQPIPEDLPAKIEAVKARKYFHIGVSPEIFAKVNSLATKIGAQDGDQFFKHFLAKDASVNR